MVALSEPYYRFNRRSPGMPAGYIPVYFVGLGISALLKIVIFVSGIMYLKHTEKYFADLI